MRKRVSKKESKKLLEWRKKQKRGAIMSPETFQEIKEKGEKKYGKGHGAKIAGGAYWRTAKSKYRKRVKRNK